MKLTSLVFIFLISTLGFSKTKPEDITAYADAMIQEHLKNEHFIGASVLIEYKGETLIHKAYGKACIELNVPMHTNHVFEIGSVTKQFTAACILKLVENDKLALDDDFTTYVPYDTQGKSITIRQLLNHTSGIPGYTEIVEFWDLSYHSYDRDTLLRMVESHGLDFVPGTSIKYSNTAFFILGLIIEKVSGMTYEEYLQQEIFDLLGMQSSYYCSQSTIIPNKAYGYDLSPSGYVQKMYIDHTWPYAAGSICSTTGDLLIWMKALHHGKVLSENSYKAMTTPEKLSNGRSLRYGFGIANYMYEGQRCIGHTGGIPGFLSVTRYYPEHDLYAICLLNSIGEVGAGEVADDLSFELIDKKPFETVKQKIDPKEVNGEYRGVFGKDTIRYEIQAFKNGLVFTNIDNGLVDSVTTYIGNYQWRDGSEIITVKDGKYLVETVVMNYEFVRVEE